MYLRILCFFTGLLIFSMLISPMSAMCAGLPEKGSSLPAFQLPSPPAESDQKYLGAKGSKFELKNLECQIVILQILGVYCPYCYEQAPLFNRLFARLNKKNLGDKVKMLGVAAGGTSAEVEYLRKNGSYEYPVVGDESFAVHKLLGEPRTPFTMLVGKDGKLLYAHQGVIEDIDTFFTLIEGHLK